MLGVPVPEIKPSGLCSLSSSAAARSCGPYNPEMKKKQPMGAYWNDTKYSKLYQLYRRVEDVATDLEKRRQGGQVPSKPYVEELFDIAIELKVLDKNVKS